METIPITYFKLLYDHIPFPVQVINDEGKIVYVNNAFSSLWGYNISELGEYKIFNDSELKKSGAHTVILNTFETGSQNSFKNYSDALLKSKEITLPIFYTKIFPLLIENRNYVVLFHEDKTDIVLAEEEAKKARDGNKEAERLKETFLTVLSHELRTPLNIILGYSSLIKESLSDKISSEDKVYLDNLYSGSERLFNSITQMLEFAQIEAGNYVLNIDTIEFNSIVKSCVDTNILKAKEKNIDLKTKFSDDEIFVDVDSQSLENTIHNLLNNALKFTRQGFIEVETSVLAERELAMCKIKDSGIGISTAYLDHLFQPFSQEDLNIGRTFEGNGLGLALAKRYIEKMGGSLLVDSIKGVGSTFTFTLPLSTAASKNDKQTQTLETKKLIKILLIDNKSESFELLSAFLKNKYVIKTQDINSFHLVILEKSNYEIIILDVNQNQWEYCLKICKEIKVNDPLKRPLIIISSEFVEEKIKEFYTAGADKFIVKPFSKKDLIKTLNESIK
jgi:two-component system, sensor histidine kinase